MALPTQANIGSTGVITPNNSDGLSYIPIGGIHLYVGTGTPNGEVTAPKGSLFVELSGPDMFQNTNAGTTWEKVGTQT